jgi:4-hydroxybenzoate polyprenyltransferase
MKNNPPLVVDLDGTLIYTDILQESLIHYFKSSIFSIFKILIWVLRGKVYLKNKISSKIVLPYSLLPYNFELINWLKTKKKDQKLILCTGTCQFDADKISNHLGLFDEVIGTSEFFNFSGKNKAFYLRERFGEKGFDYVGNSFADIHVWKISRYAYGVNVSNFILNHFQNEFKLDLLFSKSPNFLTRLFSALRPYQWLKNLILFIPLLASHQFLNFDLWCDLLLAFVSFSFCASTGYIFNDLIDIENDRQHDRKKNRPFASGQLSIINGLFTALILLFLSFGLAFLVNGNFKYWLFLYFILTCIYSLFFKKIVLLDCVFLSLLYTIRILAGGEAAHLLNSFWLLAFSVFLFLSLALVKRFAEIGIRVNKGQKILNGRGYYIDDADLIRSLGVASGYSSALILALYLNSDSVSSLYFSPYFVWADVPVLLFWISWVWLKAHRGEMHDDPIIFAIKDKISIFSGLFFAFFLLLGSLNIL